MLGNDAMAQEKLRRRRVKTDPNLLQEVLQENILRQIQLRQKAVTLVRKFGGRKSRKDDAGPALEVRKAVYVDAVSDDDRSVQWMILCVQKSHERIEIVVSDDRIIGRTIEPLGRAVLKKEAEAEKEFRRQIEMVSVLVQTGGPQHRRSVFVRGI
jgi:hypothetical protein